MRPSFPLLRRLSRFATGGAVLGLLMSCGPAEPESFERLKWAYGGGPCTEEMDCSGWDEVLADGTFRVDRFGDFGGTVRTAVLPAEELERVRVAATRAELLDVLRRGRFPVAGSAIRAVTSRWSWRARATVRSSPAVMSRG